MIGHKMGCSQVGVHTSDKALPMENFKHGWENDMDANMVTFFDSRVLHRSSFLSNFKPSYKKLDL